jgi:MFS family permease
LPDDRQSVRAEIVEGLRAVAGDRVLRALALSWVAFSAAAGVFSAVFVLYVTRNLGFSPGVQGVIYGVGGVTSFFGAVFADRCRRRFGAGGAMILGLLLGGAGMTLIVGAPPSILGVAAAVLVAQQIISDPGWAVYEINAVSLRQAVAPERLLGRVNAATRFSGLAAMLVSSLAAGALASATSPRLALACGASAMFVSALVLALSPVRRVGDLTTAVEVEPSLV